MKTRHFLMLLGFILVSVALLAACGTPTPDPTPTEPPRDDSAVREALAAGVHADTYDLGTGPNTYCAVCKSPANWDPAAVVDAPPNCVSCKFEFDTEIRVAAGNPIVPEHEWQGIRCVNCHPQDETGAVETTIAWWDVEADEHVVLEDSTDLCEQCHRNSDAGTLRQRDMAGSEAHADATCTTCHDAHSGAADCADCHNAEDTDTAFVDACLNAYLADDAAAPHPDVRCEACHDNAGLESAPVADEGEPYLGQWATWRSVMIAGSIPSNGVWVSHNLTGAVDCVRCHYEDNAWELAVDVERPS